MTSLGTKELLTQPESIKIQIPQIELNLETEKVSKIEQEFAELYSELLQLHQIVVDAVKKKKQSEEINQEEL